MGVEIDFDPLRLPPPADPYPIYRELRRNAPLHRVPGSGLVCLSRHRDVAHALRHPELFSSEAMQKIIMNRDLTRPSLRELPAVARFMFQARVNPLRMGGERPKGLVESDPPEHDELRAIVNRGFTPRRIAEWEPRVREIVAGCMAKLDAGEPFDVMRDLAVPLPVTVIAEMLGVEAERHADFKRWSDEIVSGATGGTKHTALGDFLGPLGELLAYLRGVVRERRAKPGDDLISLLIAKHEAGALDEQRLFGFIMLLLVAGNETTTNLIGNATLALLAHPEQTRLVEREPARIPALVEETLRWDTPVQTLFRQTTQDVELSGGTVPAGTAVALLMGSANRDEDEYDEPDRFDVTRDSRGHLAFGFGVHFCLGASLARLEARVALESLVPRLSGRAAPAHAPERIESFTVRGPRALPLAPAAGA